MNSTSGDRPKTRWVAIGLLTAMLLIRLAAHALFLPAYEGPDEPFHLARVAAFAEQPLLEAFEGRGLPGKVVAAVRAQPCNDGLHRTFGCPVFGQVPAAFDLLRPTLDLPPWPSTTNPETNQPPLYYLLPGLSLRALILVAQRWFSAPDVQLLFTRLFSVSLVGVALLWPLRELARRRNWLFAVLGLLGMSFPGAAEALARAANDAGVFCWAAFALWALDRRTPAVPFAAILALGPLIKLTAFPVVAVILAVLWLRGQRMPAVGAAICSLIVFPVQALRGWGLGGVLEFHRSRFPIEESLGEVSLGLLRSAYALTKTTLWLGNWSMYRAPAAVLLTFAVLVAVTAACVRPVPISRRSIPHLFGVGIAAVGFLVFAVANRRFFGGWGGVGGWYVWGWAPWLAIMGYDLFSVRSGREKLLVLSLALASLGSSIVYYVIAARLYGL